MWLPSSETEIIRRQFSSSEVIVVLSPRVLIEEQFLSGVGSDKASIGFHSLLVVEVANYDLVAVILKRKFAVRLLDPGAGTARVKSKCFIMACRNWHRIYSRLSGFARHLSC